MFPSGHSLINTLQSHLDELSDSPVTLADVKYYHSKVNDTIDRYTQHHNDINNDVSDSYSLVLPESNLNTRGGTSFTSFGWDLTNDNSNNSRNNSNSNERNLDQSIVDTTYEANNDNNNFDNLFGSSDTSITRLNTNINPNNLLDDTAPLFSSEDDIVSNNSNSHNERNLDQSMIDTAYEVNNNNNNNANLVGSYFNNSSITNHTGTTSLSTNINQNNLLDDNALPSLSEDDIVDSNNENNYVFRNRAYCNTMNTKLDNIPNNANAYNTHLVDRYSNDSDSDSNTTAPTTLVAANNRNNNSNISINRIVNDNDTATASVSTVNDNTIPLSIAPSSNYSNMSTSSNTSPIHDDDDDDMDETSKKLSIKRKRESKSNSINTNIRLDNIPNNHNVNNTHLVDSNSNDGTTEENNEENTPNNNIVDHSGNDNLNDNNSISSNNNNEEEKCTICLEHMMHHDDISTISCCSHRFHRTCIVDWSRTSNTCTMCPNKRFRYIKNSNSEIQCVEDRQQRVPSYYLQDGDPSPFYPEGEEVVDDQCCAICDDVGLLLMCDGCENGYHLECLHLDSIDAISTGNWYCNDCELEKRRRREKEWAARVTVERIALTARILEQCQSYSQQELDNDIKEWSQSVSIGIQDVMESDITEDDCIEAIRNLNCLSSTGKRNQFAMREAATRALYYLKLTEIYKCKKRQERNKRKKTLPGLQVYLREKTGGNISTINEYKQFGRLILEFPQFNLAAVDCTWEEMKFAIRTGYLLDQLMMLVEMIDFVNED